MENRIAMLALKAAVHGMEITHEFTRSVPEVRLEKIFEYFRVRYTLVLISDKPLTYEILNREISTKKTGIEGKLEIAEKIIEIIRL